jgi:AhpC/TSA family
LTGPPDAGTEAPWCPYRNPQLSAFQGAPADIPEAGATPAAISPQTPDQSLRLAQRHAIENPVLSDAGNALARQYGLLFTAAEAVTDTTRSRGPANRRPGTIASFVSSGQPPLALWTAPGSGDMS